MKVLTWTVKVELVTELPVKPGGSTNNRVTDNGAIAFMWAPGNHFDNRADVAGRLDLLPGRVLAEKTPSLYKHLRNMEAVPTIVLNLHFKDWATYYERVVKAKSDDTANVRKEKYGIAVGSAVAMIWGAEQRLEKVALEAADQPEAPEPGMTVEQRHRAVAQSARTALILLPDFDALS